MFGRALHRQPGDGGPQPQENVLRPAGVLHLCKWNLESLPTDRPCPRTVGFRHFNLEEWAQTMEYLNVQRAFVGQESNFPGIRDPQFERLRIEIMRIDRTVIFHHFNIEKWAPTLEL